MLGTILLAAVLFTVFVAGCLALAWEPSRPPTFRREREHVARSRGAGFGDWA